MDSFLQLNKHKLKFAFTLVAFIFLITILALLALIYFNGGKIEFDLLVVLLLVGVIGFPPCLCRSSRSHAIVVSFDQQLKRRSWSNLHFRSSPCLRAEVLWAAGQGGTNLKRIYNNAVSVAKHKSETKATRLLHSLLIAVKQQYHRQ